MSNTKILFLAVSGALLVRLLVLPFYPLMDTTEARYAEIARKMFELNDWITPWYDYGVPFWGKPPLSNWVTAASFHLFGVNEFAARFPHWLLGVLVLWVTWVMSKQRSQEAALYSVALLTGAAVFYVSTGLVMTDLALLLGTTLAMFGYWSAMHTQPGEKNTGSWLFFLGLAIGMLAKGPIALVLTGVPIGLWALWTGNVGKSFTKLHWVSGLMIAVGLSAPWFILNEIKSPGFLDYFFVGEHWNRFLVPGWEGDLYGNAHDEPRGTIWLFLLADALPWIVIIPVLLLVARKHQQSTLPDDRLPSYLLLWGLFPAVFFTFSGNILPSYLLPGFPALAILIGTYLARQCDAKKTTIGLSVGVVASTIALVGFVIHLNTAAMEVGKSAKEIVALYEQHKTADEPLLNTNTRSYSVRFYTQGQSIPVTALSAVAPYFAQQQAFYLIAPAHTLRQLPQEQLSDLSVLHDFGKYALIHYAP